MIVCKQKRQKSGSSFVGNWIFSNTFLQRQWLLFEMRSEFLTSQKVKSLTALGYFHIRPKVASV